MRRGLVVGLRPDAVQEAELSGCDGLLGAPVAAVEAALEADVHGGTRLRHGLGELHRLLERPGDRLFAEGRHAGLEAEAQQRRVARSGRGDDEAVDTLASISAGEAAKPTSSRSERARAASASRSLTTTSSTSLRLRRVSAWNAPMRPTPASPMRMRTLPWMGWGREPEGAAAVGGTDEPRDVVVLTTPMLQRHPVPCQANVRTF